MRIIVYVITAIAAFIFILVFAMMFSPKLRGKMMSKQVKSMKYMMDESKDDIQSISTNMADATKDGIETTTRAIKKGFTEEDSIYCKYEEDSIYCKYCGAKIDKDSKFCKSCGKEQ